MTIDQAIECQKVKLPEWYAPPLGEIVREPEIVSIAVESSEGAVTKTTAEVEWSYVPWPTNKGVRRASYTFNVEDLEPV